MKHSISFSIILTGFLLVSCQTEEAEQQTSTLKTEHSWDGKAASFVDVNNFDSFSKEGYGQIDIIVLQKLLAGVVKGDLKAHRDDESKTPMTADEVIAEIQNSYREDISDSAKTNVFIEVKKGLQIPTRDIFQIVTLDDCYFEDNSYTLHRKANKIAIVFQTYDPEGWERGKKIGFWIMLEKKEV